MFYNTNSKQKKLIELENNSFNKQMAWTVETDLLYYENVRITEVTITKLIKLDYLFKIYYH